MSEPFEVRVYNTPGVREVGEGLLERTKSSRASPRREDAVPPRMEMVFNFFLSPEGVIEPGSQFPKKRAWPFLSESAPPSGIKRV
jgi:hypothetical protein